MTQHLVLTLISLCYYLRLCPNIFGLLLGEYYLLINYDESFSLTFSKFCGLPHHLVPQIPFMETFI